MTYLTRRKATTSACRGIDWWLLDDERVIAMGFDAEGRSPAKR